jgi:hypothetical protein
MSPEGWLAVYAAVLSTYLGYLRFSESRRSLKVSCSVGVIPPLFIFDGSYVEHRGYKAIEVTCVNVGHRPIEVKAVSLTTTADLALRVEHEQGKVWKRGASRTLPEYLADGESLVARFDIEDVAKHLEALNAAAKPAEPVRLKGAVVTDAEGKKHKAKLPLEDKDLARLVEIK